MRQQVPTGFRQSRFEYQMKIVLLRKGFSPTCSKCWNFGHRKPDCLSVVFKNRPLRGNSGPWCNHPCGDPAARRMREIHQGAARWLSGAVLASHSTGFGPWGLNIFVTLLFNRGKSFSQGCPLTLLWAYAIYVISMYWFQDVLRQEMSGFDKSYFHKILSICIWI